MKVLQVFPAGRTTTNPYLVTLAQALREVEGLTVINFTWRIALLSRYDVVHLHWPENLGSGHSPLKRLVRQGLTLLLVGKWKFSGTAVVRTVHNVHRPTGISRRQRILLDLIDRATNHFITLNTHTPLPAFRKSTLIPHGHYRDWFSGFEQRGKVPGQYGFVGLIRGYKGVQQLVAAYKSSQRIGRSLVISGNPSSPELADEIRSLARGASDIRFDLRYLPDEDLVRAITSSELIVLPYRFMHNSGGVLAALSLDRPVLVPRNPVNIDLAKEVGEGWVHMFDGDLGSVDLERTLQRLRDAPPPAAPDLSARDWRDAGPSHVRAYLLAASAVENGSTVTQQTAQAR